MTGKILVFNTGSTTLKYKLYNYDGTGLYLIKKGMVDNIGLRTGPKNHKEALSILFEGFGIGVPYLGKIEGLLAIGHRVVYGGEKFSKTSLINKNILNELKKYEFVAPLHNPKIIEVIEDILAHSGQKGHRDIPNYAVFDSYYFNNLPDVAKIYPLPYEFYSDYKIKRHGFHGISHKYAVNEVLKRHPSAKKIISIHLGGGASITAVDNGIPVDTSMGFTPLEGLMMTTRSGDIDAGIIHYLIEKKIIKHSEVDNLLNNKSGLLGISGVDGNMRELLHIAGFRIEDPGFSPKVNLNYLSDEKIERTKLAIEMFIYRIKKYIGAYYAILNGCDVLVFTGRMGTGSSIIRNLVLDSLNIMQKTDIEVIDSDEEQQIAHEIISEMNHKE